MSNSTMNDSNQHGQPPGGEPVSVDDGTDAAKGSTYGAYDADGASIGSAKERDHSMFDAELAGKALDMQLLGRLLKWVAPHKYLAAAAITFVIIASTMAVLQPVVYSRVIIDGIFVQESKEFDAPDFGMQAAANWFTETIGLDVSVNTDMLMGAVGLYMLLAVGMACLGHAERTLLSRAVTLALRDLRDDLFKHLETRPASFYDKVAVGRIMTRVTNDIETLYQLLAGFGGLFGDFVPFFVALALMLAISVKMTMLLLLAIPIIAVATYFFRRATRSVYRFIRMSVSALNGNLQENVSGMEVVQLYGREEQNLDTYTALNEENYKHEMHAVRIETIYHPFIESMSNIAFATIIWFGGHSAISGEMSLGSVILFTQFVGMLFGPIVMVGYQYNTLFRAMASGERIFQALDWDEQIHEPEHPVDLPERLQGKVEFRHLNFEYERDTPVLKDVSFTIEPGEKIAIVGPTGSGKTTLIRLLARFYDFAPGQIFLDDIDLCDIRSQDIRRRLGVVLQDFHIFSGTVFDNIALGDESITRERVIEAAKLVNAHGFISALPQGYDTELQERGMNLSQGQRQLLSFARVLAPDPEILILDEATASIDTETEMLIQDALSKLMKGRTSILIAHRLQTIREANRIVVLQHGSIREIGTHDELIALGGIYNTLYELQFQAKEAA